MDSADLYNSCKAEFESGYQEATQKLNELRDCTNTSGQNDIMKQLDEIQYQLSVTLKQTEIEMHSLGSALKVKLRDEVKQMKDRLAGIKSDQTSINFQLQKASVLGTKGGEEKVRMINVNEKYTIDDTICDVYIFDNHAMILTFRLVKQNETIEQAMRTIADTEVVGEEILSELGRNRETMESSKEKV